MKGFSSRNLKYMKFFAQMCPDLQIGQQAADQLPWFHLVTILTKISDDAERGWYAAQTIRHGWSRPTLDVHIKNQLYRRQGIAVANFDRRLPAPHARLAGEALKNSLGDARQPSLGVFVDSCGNIYGGDGAAYGSEHAQLCQGGGPIIFEVITAFPFPSGAAMRP
jgi:hypothetical protein